MSASSHPVSIVLATRNGAAFIEAQLQSILAQTHDNWHIILSDDGSKDDTVARARCAVPKTRLTCLQGPQVGIAANFLSALRRCPPHHCVAFCDQDDVWFPDKLARAVEALTTYAAPAFYSASRIVTDHELNPTGLQARRKAGFARLICRSRVAGNTMVLSPSAVSILRKAWPQTAPAFHDWWAALVLIGTGATWINDSDPVLYYRQHGSNLLGAHGGRLASVVNGTRVKWVSQNLAALTTAAHMFTPPHHRQFRFMSQAFGLSQLPEHATGMSQENWPKSCSMPTRKGPLRRPNNA